MDFAELAATRRSIRRYQAGLMVSDAELQAIFRLVQLTPSSFNLQHWQFVVVRDPERKRTLRGLSFGQQQVEDCAAVILVCGRLDAHEDAAALYAGAPAEMREKFVPMIGAVYAGQPVLQREEAIRSGSLAAMSLMFAARQQGWDSGPMIGFDAKRVAALLSLPGNWLPVMMVTLGKANDDQRPPRLYRRPLSEIVHLESALGSGLPDAAGS